MLHRLLKAKATSSSARRSRRYRERQAATTIIAGKRKIKSPIAVFPLPLEKTLADIVAAHPKFEPPTDSSERAWREAIGAAVARILKSEK
jgi:hypothetical protein